RWASSRSRSTSPTNSTSAELAMVCSQVLPIAPAPTRSTRNGSATEVTHSVPFQRRRLAFPPVGMRPADAVRNNPANVLVVIHRVLLVAGREVEDPSVPAPEGAAAAE